MSENIVITKDMRLDELIRVCPIAPKVLSSLGMGCCSCMAASSETIEEGALMHGLDAQAVVDALNEMCGG
jgi:hybrid cluster-associated redox disulfide protein